MAMIGAIAVAWSEIEVALADLLATSLGSTWKQETGTYAGIPNVIARIALKQADTIRARLKLMSATLGVVIAGTPLESQWEALKVELQRRAKDRNRVVHGLWGYSDLAPNALIKDDGRIKQLWKASDFQEVLDRMTVTTRAVRRLMGEITKAKADGTMALNPVL